MASKRVRTFNKKGYTSLQTHLCDVSDKLNLFFPMLMLHANKTKRDQICMVLKKMPSGTRIYYSAVRGGTLTAFYLLSIVKDYKISDTSSASLKTGARHDKLFKFNCFLFRPISMFLAFSADVSIKSY